MLSKLYKLKDIKWESGWMGYPTAFLKIKTPSISTIIAEMIDDPEFEEWKAQVGADAEKILKYCADRGTSMHRFCEDFYPTYSVCKDKEYSLKYALETSPKSLIKEGISENSIIKGRDLFYKLYNSEITDRFNDVKATELKIYSPKLFVRGALDILYVDKGVLCVSDFKNGSKPIINGSIKEYKYKVQLGGYAIMIEHKTNGQIKVGRSTIICSNTANDEVQEILLEGEELQKYKDIFSDLATQWHIKNGQGFLLELN